MGEREMTIAASPYLNQPLRSFEQATHDVDLHRRREQPAADTRERVDGGFRAALGLADRRAGSATAGEAQTPRARR